MKKMAWRKLLNFKISISIVSKINLLMYKYNTFAMNE